MKVQEKNRDTWRFQGIKKMMNDEHMKAHIYINIDDDDDSHVSRIKLERDHIYKGIVLVYHFPHTCTSWSKSMALLSLDPQFDFTIYTIQACHIIYPNRKLHINLYRSRRKQKKAKLCYALVRIHTPLSDLRVPIEKYKVNYAFVCVNFQNSKLLRCAIRKMTLFQGLFHFSTT
jgi:hypothetical protein